jgi:hypothetical protein
MRLGWKGLVPTSLLWIMMIFAIRTWRTSGGEGGTALAVIAIVVVSALIFAFLVPDQRRPAPPEVEVASDYPVPPLDLMVPPRPRHRAPVSAEAAGGPLAEGTSSTESTESAESTAAAASGAAGSGEGSGEGSGTAALTGSHRPAHASGGSTDDA